MAEAGLVRICRGTSSHWDSLKIIRAGEIERAFSINEFIFAASPSGVSPIAG